jgi:hypothetical protein
MNEGLILVLMIWIASVTGYHIQTIPEVMYTTNEKMVYELYDCKKQTVENDYWCNVPLEEHSNILGIYNHDTQKIHIRKDLKVKYSTKVYTSILLHELVHHMQAESGKDFQCRGKKEEEAYDLQNKWLKEQGEEGVIKSLDLNALFLLMISTCTDELFGG